MRKNKARRILVFFICVSMVLCVGIRCDAEEGNSEQININSDFSGGNIVENTVFDDTNNQYEIASDIQIKYGSSLKIEPGVKMNGNGNSIYVYGKLDIDGADINDVNIYSCNQGSNPCEISIKNTNMNGGSMLNPNGNSSHARISIINNRFYGLRGYSYIWYPDGEALITGNLFENSGGIDVGSENNVYIKNNAFHGMTTNYAICDWAQYDNSQCYVEDNSFYDSKTVLEIKYDSGDMVARNNYWGTTNLDAIRNRIIDGNDDFSIKNTIDFSNPSSEKEQDTPDVQHDMTLVTTTATCESDGIETYSCALCGIRETKEAKAKGHSVKKIEKIDATCQTTGMTEGEFCEVCMKVFKEQETIPRKEHDWQIYNIIIRQTCLYGGVELARCSMCNDIERIVTDPLGHEYSKEWTIDEEATDFFNGSKSRHCIRCDSVCDVTVIPKLEQNKPTPSPTEKPTQKPIESQTPTLNPLESPTVSYVKNPNIAGSYNTGDSIVFVSDAVIPNNSEFDVDVYIRDGASVVIEDGCSAVFRKDVYVFGTLDNDGFLSVGGTLNCLTYNGVLMGEDYDYGYFNNRGKTEIGTLNIKDDYLDVPIPEQIKEPSTPKPDETEKPIQTEGSDYTEQPPETGRPIETLTPSETDNPIETIKPIGTSNPTEIAQPKIEPDKSAGPNANETEGDQAKKGKPSIKISKTTIRIKKGKTFNIKAKKIHLKGKLKFKSSNKKIATVNNKGKVRAKKVGKCYVTVKCAGIKAKIRIIVSKK